MPREYLKIIESKSKVRQTRAKAVVAKVSTSSSTPAVSSEVSELKDMVRALLLDKKNQSSAPASSSTPAPVKAVEPNCVTCGVMRNMQNQGQNVQNQLANLTDMLSKFMISNTASSSGSGTLPGPTIPTPSKVVKQGTKVTKDQVQIPSSQSTEPVQPSVIRSETQTPVFEPIVAPVNVPIPYPSRRDNERRRDQANEQIEKFYEIFKEMSFEISFMDALILMPKFSSTLKSLIGNKEKLSEMARTPMNEHCLAVILNKLPRKLGDPGKFLIPCEFPGMDECLTLADLGASINLMPLSVWEGLSLPELTPTCMTLELADHSVSKPIGIAEDVSVKVRVFHFSADFVVVDFEPDLRVPLILKMCFLKTGRALIDVYKGELPLRIRNEAITYNLDQTSRGTFSILNTEPLPPLPNHEQYLPSYKKELKVCEAKTVKSSIDEPPEFELKDLPPHLEYAFLEGDNKLPVIIAKELGDEDKSALIKVLKSHKRAIAWKLSDIQGINPEFCTHKILMEKDYKPAVQHQRRDAREIGGERILLFPRWFLRVLQIPIDPRDQEKTTFTCPYGTFSYRRMPFGLCNAPGTFQRCMLDIFHDMVEKTMEVFMDNFSVFGNSFENCLSRLDKMLQRCEDTNLSLNWEKSHFMVKEGIVLGHKISKSGIEVDKAKVDVIAKLPHPTTVKGIRSFLGHVGFYRRFIQDFSKISRPMTHLLEKNTPFVFSGDCIKAFQTLKKKLTEAPILIAPNWDLPFELMCDASDFAIGAVLGQRHEKHYKPIQYASKTMNDAESNYTTTEKEMLASIVHTDHSALKYLFAKKDAKARLLRWVLLLQ
uniref:Reverse transcriptase domain-containing protein n=1 Tax=Tanacetum cinerariifolium TaxID=118510 RepID=A0A6L2NCS8_TANCI|nr:reverse transcriptase domain-containing protein [Tanacetum cinerariifolium]